MTDIGRAGMVMKGDYNSASTYETLDAVTYNNALYIAKQNVPAGTTPPNTTYWQRAVSYQDVKRFTRTATLASDLAAGEVANITNSFGAWDEDPTGYTILMYTYYYAGDYAPYLKINFSQSNYLVYAMNCHNMISVPAGAVIMEVALAVRS